ncbi:5-oxoprolinase subunit PxpA [Hyphococcus sp.]|uniref:5-oxoprolinase subunit PxpA n=1 Tax=Hyphococcus sp. TaxID=2038636 RepID=UPI0035C77672
MSAIDLNADMGEYADETQQAIEAALMPLVTSCSIACGGHTGTAETMCATARLAKQHNVRTGAHPSYPDREGFGRRAVTLSSEELRLSLTLQVEALKGVLGLESLQLSHVKPHGALYNDAAKDIALAQVVASVCSGAVLVGPSGSALEAAAKEAGLPFAAEGFVDRLYLASGALSPRSEPGAVLADIDARAAQALAIAKGEKINARDGALLVKAETLCIHSDSPGAVETAQAVRKALEEADIAVRPFA